MTRAFYRPELKDLGNAIRDHRYKLGYSAGTFARMLGYTGTNAGRKIRYIEAAKLPMSDNAKRILHDMIKNGLPDDAPEPDLEAAIAHNQEKARLRREAREPREIEIVRKK